MSRANRLRTALLLLAAPLTVSAAGFTTNLDARVLAAHNRERAALGVPPLRWQADIAAAAQNWADELAATGRFDHEDQDDHGENLWMGTRARYAAEEMVDGWVEEKRHFRPGAFPHNSATGNVADVGHYTQLAWRDTDAVGCALARGAEMDVLVCRYARPGNIEGETPF